MWIRVWLEQVFGLRPPPALLSLNLHLAAIQSRAAPVSATLQPLRPPRFLRHFAVVGLEVQKLGFEAEKLLQACL